MRVINLFCFAYALCLIHLPFAFPVHNENRETTATSSSTQSTIDQEIPTLVTEYGSYFYPESRFKTMMKSERDNQRFLSIASILSGDRIPLVCRTRENTQIRDTKFNKGDYFMTRIRETPDEVDSPSVDVRVDVKEGTFTGHELRAFFLEILENVATSNRAVLMKNDVAAAKREAERQWTKCMELEEGVFHVDGMVGEVRMKWEKIKGDEEIKGTLKLDIGDGAPHTREVARIPFSESAGFADANYAKPLLQRYPSRRGLLWGSQSSKKLEITYTMDEHKPGIAKLNTIPTTTKSKTGD